LAEGKRWFGRDEPEKLPEENATVAGTEQKRGQKKTQPRTTTDRKNRK
jgi:hypothetical protein